MLFKKMLRELKLYYSQFLTIFLMVLIGVMAYSGIEAYMTGMDLTRNKFYQENNLQDLEVYGNNFDLKLLNQIKKIENVNDAERKLTLTGTHDKKVFNLSFIESDNISKFYIIDGIEFDVNKKGVWLDNFYAIANNLKVGDIIEFKYDGYLFKEEILGLINVPDHLYDIKETSEIYPDHKDFGFVYLSINEFKDYLKYKIVKEMKIDDAKFDKLNINLDDKIIFNNLIVDTNNNKDIIKKEIEKLDNVKAVVKIEDTLSYSVYQSEIDEGKTYVGVFSSLFIFIAMLSVITTMTRIVKNQRNQIGTLKALGFKDKKIIVHYISYALIVSVFATILGLILGYLFIGNFFMNLEMEFFQIPNGKPIMNTKSYICGILIIFLICLVTYLTCKKSLKEKPANILRNEIPIVNDKSLNITTKGLFKRLNFTTKWNIRDMLRNKSRTITAILGITGCCMLIVCALGMLDTMNNFVKIQFENLYNFKYKLDLDYHSDNELNKLINEYGNSTSMNLMAELNGKQINVFVDDSNNKIRYQDNKNNFIKLENGMYVTYKLAKLNNYKIGDTIKFKIMDGKEIESKIIGFNKDPQNQNITMTKEFYESLGKNYKPDTIYTDNDIKGDIANVSLIQNKQDLKNSTSKMLSATKTMIGLIIFVAVILGVVIIYNMSILSYTEKKYQFATLKVLGFKDKKIKNIFIKQNNIISLFAIILGLPLGYLLVVWIFKNVVGDNFDFNAHITLLTYLFAILGTYLVTYFVSLKLSKKINEIDMVSSLKGNE